jgi:VIT1/CCC1 family predicted Fe2+/Mn2+ transporter
MTTKSDKDLELKLNWLRAAVLGANDGVVSVAGVVMGVAGAGAGNVAILVAGVAALVAGAISMGGGEYVSVSAQRDTELGHGRDESKVSAAPWSAAFASLAAFTLGGAIPLIAITGPFGEFKIAMTVLSVFLALGITGFWAAKVGRASKRTSIIRNVTVSILTMSIAYGIGALLGVTVL